ncbi:PREDICTED: vomeronasal type-2 receptor 116-like [Chinchilla lanigera]|uniref:vomeronasal type-2 receptor 116-like n=1 Tax=Chinchilla lanigera TaxID=34839 RepID=UPI000696D060|nr:PREDICTED: vomeronasal type-2 receptor 116-like [Chinchilla lanigera]
MLVGQSLMLRCCLALPRCLEKQQMLLPGVPRGPWLPALPMIVFFFRIASLGTMNDTSTKRNHPCQTLLPALVCTLDNEACLRQRSTSVHKDGDVVIGCFLFLYYYIYYTAIFVIKPTREFYFVPLTPSNYQNYLAFAFAIEQINRNPRLLPNISLGYEFHNFINSHWMMLESSFILLTGQHKIPNYTCERGSKCAAVLTEMSWDTSGQIGPLLDLYRFPQVTFGSFDPTLTDSGQYSSLHQVAPKDTYLALGMVSLMLHFHWTWVGLLIAEGQKGLQFLSDIRAEMDRNRVCVAFVKMVSTVAVSYFSFTKQHDVLTADPASANVVVIYYDTDSTHDVKYNMVQDSVTCKVWVTNSRWHADLSGRDFILDPFHGTLVFSHHYEQISGFKKFVQEATPFKYPEDNYLFVYWSKNFDCSFSDCALKDCTPNASVAWLPPNRFDTAMNDRSYNIYNAVYAVAHALHAMLFEEVQRPPMRNGQVRMFHPWQLHRFLKNIQFHNPAGDQVNLDNRRKLDSEYDILNYWNFPGGLRLKGKVGTFSSHAPRGQKLTLSEDMIEWATGSTETPRSVCSESCNPGFRKSPQEGKAACCFDCTPCADNEIANGTDMEQCVKCPDHQYANTQRNHCLRKAVTFLAYGDPLGKALVGTTLGLTTLTAAVLVLFVEHRNTPIVKANNRALSYTLLISLTCCFLCSLLFIGRPSTTTCILQQTTFAVVFTVAVSSVLAKTITVVLAFKVTTPGRRMRQLLTSGAPNFIIPICSLIQLTLCGVWMGTNPPYIDTVAHSEHGHILIVCNKGSLTAFYCVLGYLGSLALLSFTVAFLARNLPIFNISIFLTFSMLVFCSVWVTFLPVYHSTKGKVMVAMEVFSILASSAGLLGCIFAPKCYIILLKPERNCLTGIRLTTSNYQNYLAFAFAIEEINRNPHLLPNISLGYEFHNSISSHWMMLENSFILLTGQHEIPNYMCGRQSKCAAVLTEMSWGTSGQIGPLLQLYRFPQVTFGSFDPTLTDSGQYPSLYQVAPKDTYLALGMVSLMLHFRWTWVGLLITEGQKGLQFLSDIRAEMDRNRVCVAFVKMISSVAVSYVSFTKQHDVLPADTASANVVVIYYDTDNTHDVNYNIVQDLVTWKVWVTNSRWQADLSGRDFILDPFHGTLVFSHHHEEISGFKKFVQEATPYKYPKDTYLFMYWSKNLGCSFSESDCALKNCTPNASVAWLPQNHFDTAMSDGSYNIYNAVYAVAHALHAMLLEEVQIQLRRNRAVMLFRYWKLHRSLRNIQFRSPAGDQVNLDDRRKLDSEYDILNFWNFPEGLRLKVKTPRSVCSESCNPGFRKSPQEGKAACCFDCIPCADNEITNDTVTGRQALRQKGSTEGHVRRKLVSHSSEEAKREAGIRDKDTDSQVKSPGPHLQPGPTR